MLAIKYSMIAEGQRQRKLHGQEPPKPQPTTYQPFNEAKFKEQLQDPSGPPRGGRNRGKNKKRQPARTTKGEQSQRPTDAVEQPQKSERSAQAVWRPKRQ